MTNDQMADESKLWIELATARERWLGSDRASRAQAEYDMANIARQWLDEHGVQHFDII